MGLCAGAVFWAREGFGWCAAAGACVGRGRVGGCAGAARRGMASPRPPRGDADGDGADGAEGGAGGGGAGSSGSEDDFGGVRIDEPGEGGEELSGAIARAETGWLEETELPRVYVRSRSKDSAAVLAAEEDLARLGDSEDEVAEEGGRRFQPDLVPAPETGPGPGTVGSETEGREGTDDGHSAGPPAGPQSGAPPQSSASRAAGGQSSLPPHGTGMTLETNAPQRFDGSGAMAAQSPYAPGIADELSEFGSSRGLPAFDLFASSGTGGHAAQQQQPALKKGAKKGAKKKHARPVRFAMAPGVPEDALSQDGAAPAAGAAPALPAVPAARGAHGRPAMPAAPEEDDVDLFETIVRGSSRIGLPFGASTPLPPGATGAVRPGHIVRPEPRRFENTFVPQHFPGRRSGNRDDEDIGSEDSANEESFFGRLIGKLRKKRDPPSATEFESTRAFDAEHKNEMGLAGKRAAPITSSVDGLWTGLRRKVAVSSWHIGTSKLVPVATLVVLRVLLLLLSVASFAVILSRGAGGFSLAYVTSAAPYAHILFTIFLCVAFASSAMQVRYPTQAHSDKLVYRLSAAMFQAAVLLIAVDAVSFIAASAGTSSLRPAALTGADTVYTFSSAYAIEIYFLILAAASEFFLNNVPFYAKFSLISFSVTLALAIVRIAVVPEGAILAVAGATVLLAAAFSATFPIFRETMGRESEPNFDPDLTAGFSARQYSGGNSNECHSRGQHMMSQGVSMSATPDITGPNEV